MDKKKTAAQSRAGKVAKTRLKIVEAAAACFITKGFHQSSMRDIATLAGVSLGNLYNHFENKAELIKGLAELEAQENAVLLRLLEDTQSPTSTFHTFIERYFTIVRAPDNAALTAEIFSEAMRNDAIYQIFDKNRQSLIQALNGLLIAGQKTGDFKSDLSIPSLTPLILDLIEASALRIALAGGEGAKEDGKLLLSVIDLWVKA
ncbi:TetR/AcrR family transcriptional regulator [Sneathiella sp.]|jgi:AcrR family transcriptional regulator|uniref:TetR/AcrR family transcriptional regulator n=1 Tax=Sneathiella sp. TaxID=1964365 RepID=UPI0039E35925